MSWKKSPTYYELQYMKKNENIKFNIQFSSFLIFYVLYSDEHSTKKSIEFGL